VNQKTKHILLKEKNCLIIVIWRRTSLNKRLTNCNMKKKFQTNFKNKPNTHRFFIRGIAIKHFIIIFLLLSLKFSGTNFKAMAWGI